MILRRAAIIAAATAAVAGLGPAAASPVAMATWAPDRRIPLEVTAGSPLTVIIGPGEKVVGLSVSDGAVVDASVTAGSDGVTIRTLRPSAAAWVSVRSDQRSYEFDLVDTASAAPAYLVEVRVPGARNASERGSHSWRLRGEKALRPASISDDGVHTYLRWSSDQLIPAVFAVNAVGTEEMVDGYMRDDVFTIDRVHDRLVFRIDRKSASATRASGSKGR